MAQRAVVRAPIFLGVAQNFKWKNEKPSNFKSEYADISDSQRRIVDLSTFSESIIGMRKCNNAGNQRYATGADIQ